MFKILKRDSRTGARTGIIETPHGVIETPAYAIVGTHGQIKCLPTEKLSGTKTGLVMTNTYHLWQNSGGKLADLPTVQSFFGDNIPTITDSGGFQVFSMGFGREHQTGKITDLYKKNLEAPKPEKNLVRITEEGTWFKQSNQPEQFLGPELSIKIQEKLGADLILAFDECTSPHHDYEYNKQATDRTHRWAKVCLQTKTRTDQILYGIVQGGIFKDLREESAKFINSLPFGGIAIGGAFEKSANGSFDVLRWTIPHLEENRPRHFLGIGKVDDIFESVELGIDTFDCVIPTREARHGGIYTGQGRIDIKKAQYEKDLSKLEENCECSACSPRWSSGEAGQKITKAELRELFKTKNPLAGEYATTHNVFFFNNLMAEIREAIRNNKLQELKKEYLQP